MSATHHELQQQFQPLPDMWPGTAPRAGTASSHTLAPAPSWHACNCSILNPAFQTWRLHPPGVLAIAVCQLLPSDLALLEA